MLHILNGMIITAHIPMSLPVIVVLFIASYSFRQYISSPVTKVRIREQARTLNRRYIYTTYNILSVIQYMQKSPQCCNALRAEKNAREHV